MSALHQFADAMASNAQVVYRDAFLGDIQTSSRILEQIRFPLIVTLHQSNACAYLPALKNLLQTIYCDRGTIDVIAKTENKLMIMFTNDQDATPAYQDLHGKTIEDPHGCTVTFKIWHPMDELGYDVADHHIYVSIKGLPQHLWKREIVDRILHPFCVLTEVSEETNSRRNLSSYTAFAWSQQRVAMPRKIALKVLKRNTGNDWFIHKKNTRKVNVYSLLVEAVGFLCDPTTQCSCCLENLNTRYESTYDPDEAQSFLTELPDNKDLLDELRHSIVATAPHGNHGRQEEEIQDMVSAYLDCSVKVHKLSDNEFMILPTDKYIAAVASKTLMDIKVLQFASVSFKLDWWNSTTQSKSEELPFRVSITVIDIPTHLCTSAVVSFLLSPYCVVNKEDKPTLTMPTSEKYSCTAWTNAPFKIPKRIMVALSIKPAEEMDTDETWKSRDLRITQLLVDATVPQSAFSIFCDGSASSTVCSTLKMRK